MAAESDGLDVLFAALASRHRREIIYALALQPHTISQLAALRGLSLPAIHKHIAILEDAGLVTRRKAGRTTYLALDRASLRVTAVLALGVPRLLGNERRDPRELRAVPASREPTPKE